MFRVRDGDFTAFVYDSIAAGNYGTVIEFLRGKALTSPNSRAVQSVLGWCYVSQQNFVAAADCYERLTMIDPDNFTYWQSYAQCLSKAGFPGEALKIVNYIADKGSPETIALLKASIRFQEGETRESKALLEKCAQTNPTIIRNQASVLSQEKEYAEAATKFSQAAAMTGFDPGCVYGQAAAAYEMKDFRQCSKYLNDIISKALAANPQFSPPFDSGIDSKKLFQNSPVLQQSYLIEAYNLKAAMEHHMGNPSAAQSSLTSIPPRNEEDIDMVTLHNKAVLDAEVEPVESIAALTHIVSQPFYPKETLANLVALYFREQQFDIAADFMAENIEVCFTQLPEDIYSLFEAVIIEQTAPEEAYVRFEELIMRYQEQLRKLSVQEKARRREGSTDKLKAVESEYDHVLSRLQPAVMSQTVMYWDYKNYGQVEKQLKRAHEFLSDQQIWRINMGHTLFMLENYLEAAKFYEAVVKPQTTDIMKLSPVLLANLCVSYVMTSRNDEAEEILRRVEDAENHVVEVEGMQGSSTSSHLCLINLVIGTLYCSKGNFQFGLNRLLKSFEPSVSAKLNRITWMYAKRMLLAALYALAHRDVMLATASLLECIEFLRQCQEAGKSLLLADFSNPSDAKSYVTAEASLLEDLFFLGTAQRIMVIYKLTYFDGRGRAEVIRLIFAAAFQKYEDRRIGLEEWEDMKIKTPWEGLPILHINQHVVGQTGPIVRYLANKFCLAGRDPWESALVESTLQISLDLTSKLIELGGSKEGVLEKADSIRKFKEHVVPTAMINYEKFAAEHGIDGHTVGNQMTVADIALFNLLETLLHHHLMEAKVLDRWPCIKAIFETTKQHPRIASYLESRPDTKF